MTELDQLREQCRMQEIMLRTLWVQNARLKSKNARLTAEVCKKQRKGGI